VFTGVDAMRDMRVAAIKLAHDLLKDRNARLIGTFAVEMIFEGVGSWLQDTAQYWAR
jgi:hypothetical protein